MNVVVLEDMGAKREMYRDVLVKGTTVKYSVTVSFIGDVQPEVVEREVDQTVHFAPAMSEPTRASITATWRTGSE